MSEIKIGKTTLELNLLDADVLERFTVLSSELVAKINRQEDFASLTAADAIRKQCALVDNFFNGLFGGDTASEIFRKKGDLGERLDAFAQVCEMAQNSGQAAFDRIAQKYGRSRIDSGRHGGKRPVPKRRR